MLNNKTIYSKQTEDKTKTCRKCFTRHTKALTQTITVFFFTLIKCNTRNATNEEKMQFIIR